jgi:hypothetical protein
VAQLDVLPAQREVRVRPDLPVGDGEPECPGEVGDLVDGRARQQRDHALAGHDRMEARTRPFRTALLLD